MAMAYATVQDVQARMSRTLSEDERSICAKLLEDAAVIIDAYNLEATPEARQIVSCRMVIRALGDGSSMAGVPTGATQGSMSALGYTQSWTIGAGAVGELYLGKLEKKLLGTGDKVGSYSPIEELVPKKDGPVW